MGIWKAATAGTGSFANGPAAHYRSKFGLLHFYGDFLCARIRDKTLPKNTGSTCWSNTVNVVYTI